MPQYCRSKASRMVSNHYGTAASLNVALLASELVCLTDELRQEFAPCLLRFEWSNQRLGHKLLFSGDWNRSATHTISGPNG